ncbi:MAG: hypothetical protein AAB116_27220 [Candidatus Poribacteria bacterium]
MKIEGDKIILGNIPIGKQTSKYRFKRKTDKFAEYLTKNDMIEIINAIKKDQH